MAWHQRHRLGLLRSRLALSAGDDETAAELAPAVAEDAVSRGPGRYELLAGADLQRRVTLPPSSALTAWNSSAAAGAACRSENAGSLTPSSTTDGYLRCPP